MGLNTEQRKDITYFTGYEVEHTVAEGMYTLFVIGTPSLKDILAIADDTQSSTYESKRVRQIYFGTSQSFCPVTYEDWKVWNERIQGCLEAGYWVCLDFDVKYAEEIHEEGWCENNKFIPMISVKLPYIKLYNYNTTLKIDDRTWGSTNSGVWTHQLHDLMRKTKYTHWDEYTQDTPV
jgi:hypothetical protein